MKAIQHHTKGLVGYWPLNETSGNAADYGTAKITGTATSITYNVPGFRGRAYGFPGTPTSVGLATLPTTVVNNFSIFALVKPSLPGNSQMVFMNGTSSGWGMSVGGTGDTSNSQLNALYQVITWINGTVALTNAQWVAAGFTRAAGTAYFYKNGVQTVPGFVQNPLTPVGSAFIGNDGGATNRYYIGTAQHIAVFNIALNANQMTKLAHLAGFV